MIRVTHVRDTVTTIDGLSLHELLWIARAAEYQAEDLVRLKRKQRDTLAARDMKAMADLCRGLYDALKTTDENVPRNPKKIGIPGKKSAGMPKVP